MHWVVLLLVALGTGGGLMLAADMPNPWWRRIAGGLISLGFVGVFLWDFFLTGASAALFRE